jgi:hypothetical protein
MAATPGLIPVIVFVVGCALIGLEICFIMLVHHGRTPRRARPRTPRARPRR